MADEAVEMNPTRRYISGRGHPSRDCIERMYQHSDGRERYRTVPIPGGGTDHLSNLQLLCSACNSLNGHRDQAYLVARLREVGDWLAKP